MIDTLPVIDIQDVVDRLDDLVQLAADGQPFMISENGKILVSVSAYHPGDETADKSWASSD